MLDSVDRSPEMLRRFGDAVVSSKPRGLRVRGYRRRGLAVVRPALVCFQVGAQKLRFRPGSSRSAPHHRWRTPI